MNVQLNEINASKAAGYDKLVAMIAELAKDPVIFQHEKVKARITMLRWNAGLDVRLGEYMEAIDILEKYGLYQLSGVESFYEEN